MFRLPLRLSRPGGFVDCWPFQFFDRFVYLAVQFAHFHFIASVFRAAHAVRSFSWDYLNLFSVWAWCVTVRGAASVNRLGRGAAGGHYQHESSFFHAVSLSMRLLSVMCRGSVHIRALSLCPGIRAVIN